MAWQPLQVECKACCSLAGLCDARCLRPCAVVVRMLPHHCHQAPAGCTIADTRLDAFHHERARC